ncbi:MAG: hypothetical protein LC713_07730, partial [Actinobacteria bacterium]|nr:hypothetical protein [Actinomycetota bacterium]
LTQVAARPVLDLQATRATATRPQTPTAEPEPAAAEAQAAEAPAAEAPAAEAPAAEAPAAEARAASAAAEAPPEAPPGPTGNRRVGPAIGAVAVIVLVVVLVIVLSGGKSSSTAGHRLTATVSAVPLSVTTGQPTSGVMAGRPLGEVAVVIQRQLFGSPTPGGRAVPINGRMFVTAPAGDINFAFHGTLQVSASGAETLQGTGTAANGTEKYLGLAGTFKLSGGRSSANSKTATYTLNGNLDY